MIYLIMSENIIIKNFDELRFAGSGTIRGIHMLLRMHAMMISRRACPRGMTAIMLISMMTLET